MNKKMNKKFYITTAIPYVNAAPHIGHALELVQADTLARYHRQKGEDVYFLTGSDENSLKNVQTAEKQNISTQELVDQNSKKFEDLKPALNLSFDDFIRTTEKRHIDGAQKFWLACKKEDLYKKKYKGLYCVGCEAFYNEDELENNKCPEHQTCPEVVEEENYFFKLSNYQKWLEELIEQDKIKITPQTRKNEVLAFIKKGLHDFSISRSKKRAHNWGIPVPGDNQQIQYVWFDALINYISALDWQNNGKLFKKYWPAEIHVIGKGISRFHAIYWPAMLKSAGLEIPKAIFIHGYVTIDGQKISKSFGNTINPKDLVEKYGTDAIRYYLLKEIPAYNDGDFSQKRLKEIYNADLANGLGNLVARVAKLCQNANLNFKTTNKQVGQIEVKVSKFLDNYQFDLALNEIWEQIRQADKTINEKKVWKQEGESLEKTLNLLINQIRQIASDLQPFLPETAFIIQKQFKGPKIKAEQPLFPRIS